MSAVGRMRGKGLKLQQGSLALNVRKKFLTVRIDRHQTRLLREIVELP